MLSFGKSLEAAPPKYNSGSNWSISADNVTPHFVATEGLVASLSGTIAQSVRPRSSLRLRRLGVV